MDALRGRPHMLGNLVGIPMHLVWPLLEKLSATDLARVEDQTWNEGHLDVTTNTWPLWRNLCKRDYGEIDMEQVPALEVAEGSDMANNLPEDAGDYRSYYSCRKVEQEEKKARIAKRARLLMEEGRREKEKRKVQFTNAAAPTKRCPNNLLPISTGVKRKTNLLSDLGLVKKRKTYVRSGTFATMKPPSSHLMDLPRAQVSSGTLKHPGPAGCGMDRARHLAGARTPGPRTSAARNPRTQAAAGQVSLSTAPGSRPSRPWSTSRPAALRVQSTRPFAAPRTPKLLPEQTRQVPLPRTPVRGVRPLLNMSSPPNLRSPGQGVKKNFSTRLSGAQPSSAGPSPPHRLTRVQKWSR